MPKIISFPCSPSQKKIKKKKQHFDKATKQFDNYLTASQQKYCQNRMNKKTSF